MKKNKIMAIIASTVIAAGTCAAAMSSFAATYVAPDLEQAQDTTKVMIVYNFTSMEKLYEEAGAEAQKQLDEQGTVFQTQEEYERAHGIIEANIYEEYIQQEYVERKLTREAIAEDIGISLDDVVYYRNDPDFDPSMECELTREQLAAAKENEDILAIADFSLGDWYEPMNYEPIELFPNEGAELETCVLFTFDNTYLVLNATKQKCDVLESALESLCYSPEDYVNIIKYYNSSCSRAMHAEVIKNVIQEGIDALGLNEEDIIKRSDCDYMISVKLTQENLDFLKGLVKNGGLIEAVSYYPPDIQPITANPTEPMTCLPYELRGDANNDIKVNLNDAVAILQYIALPEKYPLNSQGMLNADCDGVPGITGGDALWVQQQDAENMTRK